MKRINVKLLIILLASGAAFVVGVYFLHDFQARRRADGLLVLAQQKQEEEDYGAEAKLRVSYVSRRPDDVEQYGYIAKAYNNLIEKHMSEGKFRPEVFKSAFGYYERAIRSAPNDAELRKSAIEFFVRMRRYKDAISHLEHLKNQQGSLEPRLEAQLAMCYLRGGEESKASQMLAKMIGFDSVTQEFDDEAATAPDSVEAHQLLAVIYSTDRKTDVAKAIMDHLVERNPDSAKAYIARGRQFYETDRELARLDFERALELDGDNEEVLLTAAQVAVDFGEWNKAQARYERCLELSPENVMALRGLAVAAITQNQNEKAMEYLDQATEVAPNNMDLLMLRADFLLRTRQLDEVQNTIGELRELGLPRFFRDYLSGRLHEAKGEWLKAAAKFNDARPHIEQSRPQLLDQVDLMLVRCYENLAQHDRRLAAVKRLLERNPSNLQFRWFKIQALLALKQIDEALNEYAGMDRQLAKISSNSEQLLIQHLQMELMQQSRLPEEQRDFAEAEVLVRKVIQAKRINTAVKTTTLASYFEMIGEEEKAKKIMDELRRTAGPNNLAMRLGQIKTRALEEGGLEDAFNQLDALEAESGDQVAYRVLRAELLTLKQPEGFEQELLALAEDVDEYPDDAKFALWTELGKYQMNLSNYEETLKLWNRAKDVSPGNVDLVMKIYDVALLTEDDARIRTAVNELKELTGENSAEWKWARAARLTLDIRNGKLPKSRLIDAQGLVDEAIELRSGWEQLYRLKGEIALLQGRSDVAIESYQQAIDLGSTNVGLHRKLARMYYSAERLLDAETILGRLPQSTWSKMEQRIHLDILSRQGKLPEVVPYDRESTDPTDHIFVGQLFAKAGRFDEAEEALNRATDIAPESPGAWGAKVQYHALKNERDQALAILETASTKIEGEKRAIFLATSYGMLQDWEQAGKHYREAIAENSDSDNLKMGLVSAELNAGNVDAAAEVLREVIAGDSGEYSSSVVAIARRKLAEIIASEGTYEAFQKALALLNDNEKRLGVLTNDDLIVSARLALGRVEKATRREAVEKLEQIQEERTLSDGAKLILAELYHGLDDWSSAQSMMLDLLSRNPSNPALLEKWLVWLLDRGELRQAARWVDNADPRSTIYTRVKSVVDANNGNTERAIRRLKSLVPQELNEATWPVLKTVALLMEEVAQYEAAAFDEAEALWKKYAAANRGGMLELAMHYKRRNDPTKVMDAFRVCQLAIKNGQGPLGIQTGIDLLRKFNGRLEGQSRYEGTVAKWIEAELANDPDRGTLYIQRSELEDLMGNSEESISWMRRFLEKDGAVPLQKALVSNNLAFKLALAGESAEAQALLDDSLRFFGPRPELRDTQGVIHYARQEYTEAADEFTSALNEGEPSAGIYLHLALAKYKANEKEDAELALRTAEELGLDPETLTRIERQLHEDLVRDLKREGFLLEPEVPEVEQQVQNSTN